MAINEQEVPLALVASYEILGLGLGPSTQIALQLGRLLVRRRFLRPLGGLGAGLVAGCGNESVFKPKEDEGSGPSTPTLPGEPNPGPLNKAAFYPAAADPDPALALRDACGVRADEAALRNHRQ